MTDGERTGKRERVYGCERGEGLMVRGLGRGREFMVVNEGKD